MELPTPTMQARKSSLESAMLETKLYKYCGQLVQLGDNASVRTEAYQAFIDAAKGSLVAGKKIACYYIPRFWKYFPSLQSEGINAQIHLCNDCDASIGK